MEAFLIVINQWPFTNRAAKIMHGGVRTNIQGQKKSPPLPAVRFSSSATLDPSPPHTSAAHRG
jgi:hypothetical protein